MRTKGERGEADGVGQEEGIPFYLLRKSSVVPMGVLMVCAPPMPGGVSSSAFWRKLGWGSPAAFCSGQSVLVMVCGYLTVLDPKTRQQLNRELWVSKWAVPTCAILEQPRVVQSLPTTVRGASWWP